MALLAWPCWLAATAVLTRIGKNSIGTFGPVLLVLFLFLLSCWSCPKRVVLVLWRYQPIGTILYCSYHNFTAIFKIPCWNTCGQTSVNLALSVLGFSAPFTTDNLLRWLNCNVDFPPFPPASCYPNFFYYFIRYYFLILCSHLSLLCRCYTIYLPFSTCPVSLVFSATLCLSSFFYKPHGARRSRCFFLVASI